MTDTRTDTLAPRRTRADRMAEVHERAMRRFDAIWEVVRDERAQNLRDRRFAKIRGAQWEGQFAIGEEGEDSPSTGAPRMEVPKFQRAIRRVTGEYRASRKTVDFKAKGDDAGDRDADNLDGLYRNDEHDTPGGGQAAYDNAFNEAINGGFGAWYLRPRFEDESDEANEHQRIAIEPIYDADQNVFFDLDAKHQDKSDARFGFLLVTMSRDAFEDKYPDASPSTFSDKLTWTYDWIKPDTITLAEYFEVEDRSVLRRTYRQTALEGVEDEPAEVTHDDARLIEERDGDLTLEAELEATGWTEVRRRRIKRARVRRYVLSGAECLEDAGEVPGRHVPIVPLYAERSYVDGIERASGMVRPVIDAVRIYNLMVSGLAEAAAGPSDSTPIINPEQMRPEYARIWARRKIDRPAYLPLDAVLDEGGNIVQPGLSGTLPAAEVSPALAALIQIAGADIADLSGANDRPERVPANTSAAAIEMVNDRGDVNDFLWQDNFGLAMQHSGRVWLGMARELYVEPGRRMEAIDPKGGKSVVTLAQARIAGDGNRVVVNDLTTGNFDVEVDVGPATKTKRDATVKGMLGIANAYTANGNAENANAALGVAVLNMEGEGLDAYQAWVRKQGLNQGWVEPTEEEAAALQEAAQNPAPDPNAMLAEAQTQIAQAEVTKAQAATVQAEARVLAAQAGARKAEADTAVALAGIDRDDRAQILDEVRAETESDRKDREQALKARPALERQTEPLEADDGD